MEKQQLDQHVYGGEIISWFPNLMETQVDLIATTLTSLTSPLFTLLNPNNIHNHNNLIKPELELELEHEYEHEHDYDHGHEPSATVNRLIRRAGHGVLAAVYTGVVLTLVMAVAVVLAILLVNSWAEEPVFLKHKLHFDYTDVNPEALVVMGRMKRKAEIPVGHSCHVSVGLLVPDSDYNRDIGVFQLRAEVVSTNGRTIARSSQPTMLQFRSHPIRLMRTFLMGLPVVFGFKRETQKIKVQMLKYREDNLLRTEAIKITLMPRAGTPYLPQLYEAELLMHSKLPRLKELVHNWKLTLYVWVSMYVYVILLILLMSFSKSLLAFPTLREPHIVELCEREDLAMDREEKPKVRKPQEREFSEALRKWQQYRRKRKAELFNKSFMENVNSASASSYTITKEDIGHSMDEDVGDSESVCLGLKTL